MGSFQQSNQAQVEVNVYKEETRRDLNENRCLICFASNNLIFTSKMCSEHHD